MRCPCRPLCFQPKPGCKPASPAYHGGKVPVSILAQAVEGVALFEGLERPVVEHLLADATVVRLARGHCLFEAGSEADAFYIVVDGQVKLYALTPDGRESIVEVFAPGSSFGEAMALCDGVFPLSAEVIEDAALIRVGRLSFARRLRETPSVARTMIAALALRNRQLEMEIQALKASEPWQRVAAYLVALAGKRCGSAVVELPFNKEVFASRVGIRRESLSRVFSRLRAIGVETVGASIVIRDLEALSNAWAGE